MHNGRVVATTPEYADVNKLELAARPVPDRRRRPTVPQRRACSAPAIADKLFPFDDPLGQTVVLGSHDFQRRRRACKERMPTGGTGGSQAAEDFNNDVYIPLATSAPALRRDDLHPRTSGSRGGEQVELSQVTLTVDANIDNPGAEEGQGGRRPDQGHPRAVAPEEGLGGDGAAGPAGGGRARRRRTSSCCWC